MQNYQSITLDVNNCVEYKYINAKQGDIASRFLKITLMENGEKIVPTSRCTASFRCLKPDGRICVNKSTINSDGTITAALTEQVLASAGTVRADISLLDGKTVLSSSTFFITVEASPATEGNVLSSDEFLILVETTNQAVEAINSLNDAIDHTQSVVNEVEDIKAYIGYTDSDILGLCVDYENKKCTRLAGAAGKTAGADFDSFNMYGGMRRCNVNDNGEITAYYGDDDFVDNDSAIQVMVYVPKFYYKVVPLKLDKNTNGLGYHIRKANYYITDTPKAGFKLHPAFYDENGNEIDYFLYSAYEGALYRMSANPAVVYNDAVHTSTKLYDNDLILSRYNTKPITGQNLAITRTLVEKYCSNRGAGWHSETIQALSALKLLMMIEYGSMNLQTALGYGVSNYGKGESDGVNYAAITGSTRSLGNESGEATATYFQYYDKEQEKTVTEHLSDAHKVSCSYRGIENPYGNLWRYIQGINVWGNGEMAGGQPYICNDFNYNELMHSDNYKPVGFTIANQTGYINAMGYGSEEYDWLFMPSEIGGTSALPVGDYWYEQENENGHRIVRHGGAWNYGVMAGMFAGTSNSIHTAYGVTNGCRLIYIPQN
ncbi:MAG: phage baseplate upper protein [Eubacterium sp.]|nr:phage baseplate upper protein [Eubacterium sp.]